MHGGLVKRHKTDPVDSAGLGKVYGKAKCLKHSAAGISGDRARDNAGRVQARHIQQLDLAAVRIDTGRVIQSLVGDCQPANRAAGRHDPPVRDHQRPVSFVVFKAAQ